MSDPAYANDPSDELTFSDLDGFGKFLATGKFDEDSIGRFFSPGQSGEGSIRDLIDVCHLWLVAKQAEVWRWMRDAPALWPPMHKGLDKLRKDLHQQNAQIHGLCAGRTPFL